MRRAKSFPAMTLLLIGAAMVAGNLWFIAARSTISISLSGKVVDKQVRREHTPGVDDVHFLIFDNGRRLHVDKRVFDAVEPPQAIRKGAWSWTLRSGDQTFPLEWSIGARRMVSAMPLVFAILVAAAWLAVSSKDEVPRTTTHQTHINGDKLH